MDSTSDKTQKCATCGKNFVIDVKDFDFYKKIAVPAPGRCFTCRLQRQLAFWPFGKFHKRKSDLNGENIISIFSDQARFPVYKTSEWFSDDWKVPSAIYDPLHSFFDQLYELQSKTPHPHQFGTKNTNCEWSDDVWESKNCYLSRSLANCENLSYSYRNIRCHDSFELTYCYETEQSYDCTYCFRVNKVKYAFDVRDSFNSAFLYDCRNVQNCFMCWNLRNKKYNILNKQYSEEEYHIKLKDFKLTSYAEIEKLKTEFEVYIRENAIHKENLNVKAINSSGNFLTECKNCKNSFFLENSEDCKNVFRGLVNKDSYDSSGIWKGEKVYQVMQITQGYNLKNSIFCTNCRNSEYLDFCIDCEDCFGCIGLKKKRYCILNRQYSEDEYIRLVAEIKERMKNDGSFGEFFPLKLAYVGYNLSLAGIAFPLTKAEVENLGGKWEELEKAHLSDIQTSDFIDDINDVQDSILAKGFLCEETSRAFNITRDELSFYQKHSIPLPHIYPDIRTMRRMKKLFAATNEISIKCFACSKDTISFYSPELGYRKIACESCYQSEIV